MTTISHSLSQLAPISLKEMKQVQLMNRIDTKYLMSVDSFIAIAPFLAGRYCIQTINGKITAPYQTLYFDTPDINMYIVHHDRKMQRQKIRTRRYRNTYTTFCEIKNKDNKGRTDKLRIPILPEMFETALNDFNVQSFIKENLKYDISMLAPHVENSFERITLVNVEKTERITIDSNIEFKNHHTGKSAKATNLIIIEIKQEGRSRSYFKELLLNSHIQPKSFSKYCLGTILTNSEVKYNRFKMKLRYIEKITGTPFSQILQTNHNQ